MKKTLFFVLFLLNITTGHIAAQSIQSFVVSAAGNHFVTDAGSLSITIGEPVVGHFSAGGYVLTAGFQQSFPAVQFRQIIATAGAGGTITPYGTVNVANGSNQTFVITPSTGYYIADVLVNGASIGAVNSYQFTNVTANHSIHASFALNTYTLTYLAGANGSISGQAVQTVSHGSNGAPVTAVPNNGYHFTGWSDGSSANPRTDLNVTANLTVTANFAATTYTIAATAGQGGNITPSGNITVNHGQNQSFTITPNAGYHITDVLVNGASVGAVNSYQFTNVTANQSIHTIFALNTYTLTYLAGANGSISGQAVQTVSHGSNGTAVTAVPNNGYHFTGWSDGSSANPRTDLNVTANLTVTANFAATTYTIAATAGQGGNITPSGNITVNHGQNQSFTITPNAGYHITDVLVNGASVGAVNSYQFTNVTANQSIHASFALNTYTLTYLAGANGSISGQAVQTVSHGSNGTAVTAVPNNGYHFTGWSDGSSANPRTDLNVTANLTVTANFAATTYTIAATAGQGGSITPSGNVVVGEGQNQSFTITPDAGYHIADVLVNGASIGAVNSYQFTNVTANQSIHASFAQNTYTLTYLAGANGSISGQAVQTVSHGSNGAPVTAVPNNGYHFTGWSDGSNANPRTDLNVTANLTVTANFAVTTYTIAATAGQGGNITPSGNITVNHGQNQSFSITPNTGYNIADVLVNGASVGAVNSYQFTNVTANQSIHASFAQNTYTLTYLAGANGSISGQAVQTVSHGGNGTAVTAVPNNGYHFTGWSDGSSANPRTDLNVTANLTVTANFAATTYTIAATAGQGGNITPSGNVVVGEGQNQSFTITPNAGYHIADVLVNGASVGAVNSYQFTNVTANQSIHASFALNTYTLTYLAGANGSISGQAVQTVSHGSNGTAVTAVPNNGYHFTGWSDGSSANPRTDLNVTANLTVTANFAATTYTIAATAGQGGSITPSGNVVVGEGQNQSFTITPDAGYHIADVLVNGASIGAVNSYQFTNVTANQSIHASFAQNTYTLTYLAGANGSISGQAVQTVSHGSNGAPVTAVPNNGYHFTGWSDGSNANPRTDLNVTANLTVTANFAVTTYTIAATAGQGGNITPSGNITVNHGQNQSFSITPNTGYNIADVLVNGASVGAVNSYQFTNVTANQSIHASFAQNTYTLTYLAGANGSISGQAVQTVSHGGNGTAVTAVPNNGYHFTGWSDGSSANPRTDLNVTANLTVTANFAATTYTIAATAGQGGNITPSGNVVVGEGQNQSFTITPNAGYHIADVLVNGASVGAVNSYQFTNVTANQSIHASFALNTYTLTYLAGAGGSISGQAVQTVSHGSNGTAVTAVPNNGYHFTGWSDGSTANPRTDLNVTGNLTVTANFAATTYTIAATAGQGGNITPSGNVVVGEGQNQSFVFHPSQGYRIMHVYVDGVDIGSPEAYTFINVIANHSIQVVFTLITGQSDVSEDNSKINIYPNPVSYILQFELYNIKDYGFLHSYEIIDIKGKVLLNGWTTDVLTSVDVSLIDQGIYFIRISNNHWYRTVKFIIVR